MRFPLAVALILAGCAHTDTPTLGVDTRLPPPDPPTEQVLSGSGPAIWTPDGSGILYLYSEGNPVAYPWPGAAPTIACMGIIPRLGGTRRWSNCDASGPHVDSADVYSIPALHPDGRLLYLQAVTPRPAATGIFAPVATSIVFWLADSANPLGTRRPLFTAPQLIGDSVISWLDRPRWVDDNSFIVAGMRYRSAGKGNASPIPIQLLRGTLTPTGASFQAIPGTLNAYAWTLAPNGDILFLKAQWYTVIPSATAPSQELLLSDSTIWRVPVTGGTPTVAVTAPRRLDGLSCAGTTCLAWDRDLACVPTNPNSCVPRSHGVIDCSRAACPIATTTVFHFDPVANALRVLLRDTRTGIELSPAGDEYLYFKAGHLLRAPLVLP